MVRPRPLLLALLLAGCDGVGVWGQTTVAIDIRFSRTARDPLALARRTNQITLAVTGEGLSEPVETTLAPVSQIVTLQLPPGFKDFSAQAWSGNQLLAEGQAGGPMEKGRQLAVILNLVPLHDPPAGGMLPTAQAQLLQKLHATTQSLVPSPSGPSRALGGSEGPGRLQPGPMPTPEATIPGAEMLVAPGAWPSPYGARAGAGS